MIKPLKIKYNEKYDTHTINKMLHEESRITVLADKINEIIKHVNKGEVKNMNGRRITNPTKSPTVQKGETRPEGTMDFGKAMRMIVKGKKIRKLEWGKKWFAFLYKEDASVALSDQDGEIHSWIITEGDIIGKDYVIA